MAYENGKTYYIIPTCATGDAAYNQKILNKEVSPLALNTAGVSDYHYNNRNVNVYSLDWSADMQWKVMVYDGFARILCASNTAFGLDYYYGNNNAGNCDIYQVSGNDEDSKINFRTINASENLYRIQCYRNNADNNLYLTATGTSNGADVRWEELDSSKAAYQTWWLVPVENIAENTPPSTPSTIYTGILARHKTPQISNDKFSYYIDGIPVDVANNILNRSYRLTDVKSPLSSARDLESFKLYCNDVGLLYTMLHLNKSKFLDFILAQLFRYHQL